MSKPSSWGHGRGTGVLEKTAGSTGSFFPSFPSRWLGSAACYFCFLYLMLSAFHPTYWSNKAMKSKMSFRKYFWLFSNIDLYIWCSRRSSPRFRLAKQWSWWRTSENLFDLFLFVPAGCIQHAFSPALLYNILLNGFFQEPGSNSLAQPFQPLHHASRR